MGARAVPCCACCAVPCVLSLRAPSEQRPPAPTLFGATRLPVFRPAHAPMQQMAQPSLPFSALLPPVPSSLLHPLRTQPLFVLTHMVFVAPLPPPRCTSHAACSTRFHIGRLAPYAAAVAFSINCPTILAPDWLRVLHAVCDSQYGVEGQVCWHQTRAHLEGRPHRQL